jgi:Cellulase (glycosyl hydrolase family 5)/Glycoside hydrolase family 5 C-terminal domain
VSPHALTSTGLGIEHQIPRISQAVYSPHYYDPLVIAGKHYLRKSLIPILKRLKEEARIWGMPLFLGEFGFSPRTGRGRAFRRDIYDALDHTFTSATQWNYTPGWTDEQKDGWNLEDFSVVDQTGSRRANFEPRPYPQTTSGEPITFTVNEEAKPGTPWFTYDWIHDPSKGSTEIYVGEQGSIQVTVSLGTRCAVKSTTLLCTSDLKGRATLHLVRSHSYGIKS